MTRRPRGPAGLRHAAADPVPEQDVRRDWERRPASTSSSPSPSTPTAPASSTWRCATTSACRRARTPTTWAHVVRHGRDAVDARGPHRARPADVERVRRLLPPPLQTASSWMTLDRLSGGRAILGVGAGHLQAEFETFGIPYDERGQSPMTPSTPFGRRSSTSSRRSPTVDSVTAARARAPARCSRASRSGSAGAASPHSAGSPNGAMAGSPKALPRNEIQGEIDYILEHRKAVTGRSAPRSGVHRRARLRRETLLGRWYADAHGIAGPAGRTRPGDARPGREPYPAAFPVTVPRRAARADDRVERGSGAAPQRVATAVAAQPAGVWMRFRSDPVASCWQRAGGGRPGASMNRSGQT